MEFANSYDDAEYARAYATLEFQNTYHLAYRDLPEIFARHVAGRRAVDFGCGTGRSTRYLRAHGFEAVDVDIAGDMISEAIRRAQLSVAATCRPLARGDEPYRWVSETRMAPWVIYVLRRAHLR